METMEFTLSVGAKRQVTIPQKLMNYLELQTGSQLRLEVSGGRGTLTPMVSVPREALPSALRAKFLSRTGMKDSDLSLKEFLDATAPRGSSKKKLSGPRPRKG